MQLAAANKAANTRQYHRTANDRKTQDTQQEQTRRLYAQLLVCVALFAVLYVGKGIFPEKIQSVKTEIIQLITKDVDFKEAFSRLGQSFSDGKLPFLQQVEEFCVEVFAPSNKPQTVADPALSALDIIQPQCSFLSAAPDAGAIAAHLSSLTQESGEVYALLHTSKSFSTDHPEENIVTQAPAQEPQVLPVGAVITAAEYSGKALPKRYTMDQLSLGALETVTPVLGHLNSGFGYRDHPIKGEYLFHGGVDISGNMGDAIGSFADGTVQYIGEDDSYGLYLQVDHGNGIKSFYAHCSKVLVKKGERVTAGQTIAKVGSSGAATGPHLHMELRCGDYRVDPAYYIDTLG